MLRHKSGLSFDGLLSVCAGYYVAAVIHLDMRDFLPRIDLFGQSITEGPPSGTCWVGGMIMRGPRWRSEDGASDLRRPLPVSRRAAEERRQECRGPNPPSPPIDLKSLIFQREPRETATSRPPGGTHGWSRRLSKRFSRGSPPSTRKPGSAASSAARRASAAAWIARSCSEAVRMRRPLPVKRRSGPAGIVSTANRRNSGGRPVRAERSIRRSRWPQHGQTAVPASR